MNVLYLGPYRQADNWGVLSRSFLNSLISLEDLHVSCRPMFMGSSSIQSVDADIIMSESKKKEEYDVLIQHTLPNYAVYDGKFSKNIIITSFETADCKTLVNNLRLLDTILVQTEAEKNAAAEEIRNKVRAIGFSSEFKKNILPKQNSDFLFYAFAGDLEENTGIKQLLLSYMLAFHVNDNVSLIIQANNLDAINNLINETSQIVGIYNKPYYPKIHIIEDANNIHEQADCFIDCSKLFGMNENVAKALINGRCPIVLKGSGKDEYVSDKSGFIVDSVEARVLCRNKPMPDMFQSTEKCVEADIDSLISAMTSAYRDKIGYMNKSYEGEASSDLMSQENQAKILKEIICS